MLRWLPSQCAKVLIADPPYGINYSTRATGERVTNDVHPFLWYLGEAFRVCSRGGSLVNYCRWDVEDCFRTAIVAAGFRMRSQVIWDRAVHGMGNCRQQFGPRHDTIWFATRGGFAFTSTRPQSVIKVMRPRAATLHPTEKPVQLQRELLRPLVRPHALVIDPFSGSGSAGVAAMQLGCRYIGIELEASHCRTARHRIGLAVRDLANRRIRNL